MGYDYALVHLKYNIPPAIALTLLYRPLLTKLDVYKILFLIFIAVTATTPWDSYLIRRGIWTYPPNVIVGPTLFDIPLEEVFFFFIQTYNTSLIYLLLSKFAFKPIYLLGTRRSGYLRLGQAVTIAAILYGVYHVRKQGEGFYLGLILVWAGPFILLLWTLAYQFLLALPLINTLGPIAIPTFFLWVVDTLALQKGTWSISSGTKLGATLWSGFEIEEAIFFLMTNMLIVFGLVAFEQAVAILESFPSLFPEVPPLPTPVMMVRALLVHPRDYDMERINGMKDAVSRLQKKSRSFYLASSVFSGRLRIDLVLLYSFCRVADDLIDNASSKSEAELWIRHLTTFLDLSYSRSSTSLKSPISPKTLTPDQAKADYIRKNFPTPTQSSLVLLPTHLLPAKPLYDLLEGFKTDLEFPNSFPITDSSALELYASRVAGTVAELVLQLVFCHYQVAPSTSAATLTSSDSEKIAKRKQFLVDSGARMGVALQYVNIARDISVDAKLARVYIPSSWLAEKNLSEKDIIECPRGETVGELRERLLVKAFGIYEEAKDALESLPMEARGAMRVAVESYMEIGRVMNECEAGKGTLSGEGGGKGNEGFVNREGRATVPRARRVRVAWRALSQV